MSTAADAAVARRGRAVRGPRGPHGRRVRAAAPRRPSHRFLGGRSAADVLEPIERAVADPALVAAMGPGRVAASVRDRHAVQGRPSRASRAARWRPRLAEACAAVGRRASPRPRCGARGSRSARGRPREAEADARAAHVVAAAVGWQRQFVRRGLIEVLVERARARRGAGACSRGVATARSPRPQRGAALLDALDPARRARRRDGALADQLESRQRHGEACVPTRTSTAGCGSRCCSTRPATMQRPPRARRRGAEWARVWDTPGYIGQALTVVGAHRAAATRASRHCGRPSSSSSARPRGASSPRRWSSSARRCGAAASASQRASRCAARSTSRTPADCRDRRARTGGAARDRGPRRRARSTGLASLTPSERRIAELAAAGASNPEIAQALFVTVKTVEMHLGHAYRKLGIRSRRQLAPPGRAAKPGCQYRASPSRSRRRREEPATRRSGPRSACSPASPSTRTSTSTWPTRSSAWMEGLERGPVRDLPGYLGSMTLVDRENARLVGIGFYDSAGQRAEADAMLAQRSPSRPGERPGADPARARHGSPTASASTRSPARLTRGAASRATGARRRGRTARRSRWTMRVAENSGPCVAASADAGEPGARDAVGVALVELGRDLLLEQPVAARRRRGASCAPWSSSTSPRQRPAVGAVVALGPPAVEHAELQAAVDGGLHAARAARLQRRAREVDPDVAAAHQPRGACARS